MDLDWSIPSVPQVTKDDLEFGIKGLLFPDHEGEVAPPVTAPIMPYKSAYGTQNLQAFVSNYVFDSFAYSFLRTNDINLWSNYTKMPDGFPLTLTTSGLNKFFPGLESNYGADLPINIEYTLDRIRNFTVQEANQNLGFSADLTMRLFVEFENNTEVEAVVINLNDFSWKWTAQIKGMGFTANVTEAHIGELIDVHAPPFVKFELWLVKVLLNEGLSWGMPLFNTFIADLRIEIPSLLFGLFELSDLKLKFHNDYVEAGLTPHFIAPKVFIKPEKFVLQGQDTLTFNLGEIE